VKKAMQALGKRTTPCSQTDVVDAALRVIGEAGVEVLTIRGVAAASRVPTMSLYAHFQNKMDLVELMREALVARLLTVPMRESWRATLEQLCCHVRTAILANPGWLSLLGPRLPLESSPIASAVEALMIAEGISARVASRTVLDGFLLSLGLAQAQLLFLRSGAPRSVAEQAGQRSELDWDGSFAATVACWIAGLEATSPSSYLAEAARSTDSTSNPPPRASRSQTSSEPATASAVTVPWGDASSLGWPPESGSSMTAPG
jgi:AcrR family transcriptional regulator